jgi:hypothetical protein
VSIDTTPTPTPQPELVTVPHSERGNFADDAEYTIAEAMRLHAADSPGRIKFRPGATLAVRSLLAAGWTPPGEGSDEAARLRLALEQMQRELDDMRASAAWAHEAEEKANVRRGGMAATLTRTVANLREQAKVAAADGEPEPTLPVTKVAAALEKALARDRR